MAFNILGAVTGAISGGMGGGGIGDIIGGMNKRTDDAMKLQDATAENQHKLAVNGAKTDSIKLVANAIRDNSAGNKDAADREGQKMSRA